MTDVTFYHAACRAPGVDPEVFFPVAAPGTAAYDRDVAQAKSICRACPLIAECRAFALDVADPMVTYPTGVFGGLTAEERATLRGTPRARLARRTAARRADRLSAPHVAARPIRPFGRAARGSPRPRARAQCPECGYRMPARVDGAMIAHYYLYHPCPGSGRPAVPGSFYVAEPAAR